MLECACSCLVMSSLAGVWHMLGAEANREHMCFLTKCLPGTLVVRCAIINKILNLQMHSEWARQDAWHCPLDVHCLPEPCRDGVVWKGVSICWMGMQHFMLGLAARLSHEARRAHGMQDHAVFNHLGADGPVLSLGVEDSQPFAGRRLRCSCTMKEHSQAACTSRKSCTSAGLSSQCSLS